MIVVAHTLLDIYVTCFLLRDNHTHMYILGKRDNSVAITLIIITIVIIVTPFVTHRTPFFGSFHSNAIIAVIIIENNNGQLRQERTTQWEQ